MKVLKIRLKQSQAHYRKEETSRNKMTYPLPPLSTIIGAVHSACGYREYHPMNVSVQGKYRSMYKRPYTDYCFLNSVMDDRGILVKFPNDKFMSRAFTKVGTAKKSQGNSFRKQITIDVHNKDLMDEYIALKDLNDEIGIFKKERIEPFKKLVKIRKASLTLKKKKYDKKSDEFKFITEREKELKVLEKTVTEKLKEYAEKNYTTEVSKYASLTTALKYYEILTDVELVLHIEAEEKVMEDIRDNIYNLRSIGRSEDTVEIIDCELIELELENLKVNSKYSAYLKKEVIEDKQIIISARTGITARGTRYFLNKDYEIRDGKRIFNKVNVLYTSRYNSSRKKESLIDRSEETPLIVNLI